MIFLFQETGDSKKFRELSDAMDAFNNPVEIPAQNPQNFHNRTYASRDSFEQFQKNRKNQTYQSNADFGDNYFDKKFEERRKYYEQKTYQNSRNFHNRTESFEQFQKNRKNYFDNEQAYQSRKREFEDRNFSRRNRSKREAEEDFRNYVKYGRPGSNSWVKHSWSNQTHDRKRVEFTQGIPSNRKSV